jgi:hypothetical protein
VATQREIELIRSEVTNRIEKWRELQAIHMTCVKSLVLSEMPCGEEIEKLFLPSHFSAEDREQLKLTQLAVEEAKLREGQAVECIMQLRRVTKTISIMRRQKKKHDKGQRESSRSQSKIKNIECIRDRFLSIYGTCRTAMKNLGMLYNGELEERFPDLSVQDLFRKSTVNKRQLGDTY